MTIQELQHVVHTNSRDHGFWPELDAGIDATIRHRMVEEQIPLKLALIHSEISEALEEYRDGNIETYHRETDGKPEGFGIELADAIIRILDLAEALDIDLQGAIEQKHAFNVTRP
jgi:NTP pyrophosphatase (non-canonical NTP hydrolase)